MANKAENDVESKTTSGGTVSPSRPIVRNTATVDGDTLLVFPVKSPIAEHVRNLRKMPLRDDDVIICAFPKSGTHWIWEVTQMLIAGKTEYHPDTKIKVMLEANEVEECKSLSSPRVLNTHLLPRQLSKDLVTKKSRVIHVIRNPKDVAVSFYFHMIQLVGVKDTGAIDFAEAFLQGEVAPGSYFDYFAYLPEMMKWQRDHPDVPVINIYFEDVKKEPVKSVERLAKFLQVDASKELCKAIAEQCSFKKLKEADDTLKRQHAAVEIMCKSGVSKLFRKGEVGDWKNYFTVALSEQYDREVPEKLKGCDINFQYTI